jgi:hypothetical protein
MLTPILAALGPLLLAGTGLALLGGLVFAVTKIARNKDSAAIASSSFSNRCAKKQYLAILQGKLVLDNWPLFKNRLNFNTLSSKPSGPITHRVLIHVRCKLFRVSLDIFTLIHMKQDRKIDTENPSERKKFSDVSVKVIKYIIKAN